MGSGASRRQWNFKYSEDVTKWTAVDVKKAIDRWDDVEKEALHYERRGTGMINRREFWGVFTDLETITGGEFLSLPLTHFEAHDLEGTGLVHVHEPLVMCCLFCEGMISEKLALVHRLFLAEGRDFLKQDDFRRMLKAVLRASFTLELIKKMPTDQQVNSLSDDFFFSADRERNGEVHIESFTEWSTPHMSSMSLLKKFGMASQRRSKAVDTGAAAKVPTSVLKRQGTRRAAFGDSMMSAMTGFGERSVAAEAELDATFNETLPGGRPSFNLEQTRRMAGITPGMPAPPTPDDSTVAADTPGPSRPGTSGTFSGPGGHRGSAATAGGGPSAAQVGGIADTLPGTASPLRGVSFATPGGVATPAPIAVGTAAKRKLRLTTGPGAGKSDVTPTQLSFMSPADQLSANIAFGNTPLVNTRAGSRAAPDSPHVPIERAHTPGDTEKAVGDGSTLVMTDGTLGGESLGASGIASRNSRRSSVASRASQVSDAASAVPGTGAAGGSTDDLAGAGGYSGAAAGAGAAGPELMLSPSALMAAAEGAKGHGAGMSMAGAATALRAAHVVAGQALLHDKTGFDFSSVSILERRAQLMKQRVFGGKRTITDIVASTDFTKREVLSLVHVFNDHSDITGSMGLTQFSRVMVHAVPALVSASMLPRAFSVFDKSKRGTLTFRDFCRGLDQVMKGGLANQLLFVFRMYSAASAKAGVREENEVILVQELVALAAKSTKSVAATMKFCDNILAVLDVDSDGGITSTEFTSALLTHPVLMDAFTSCTALNLPMAKAIADLRTHAPMVTWDAFEDFLERKAGHIGQLTKTVELKQLRDFFAKEFDVPIEAREHVDRMYFQAKHDPDRNPMLRDILVALAQVISPATEASISLLFRLYDLDSSGDLDKSEILHMLMYAQRANDHDIDEVIKMLDTLDVDGDGHIDIGEFKARAPRVPLIMQLVEQVFRTRKDFSNIQRARTGRGGSDVMNDTPLPADVTTAANALLPSPFGKQTPTAAGMTAAYQTAEQVVGPGSPRKMARLQTDGARGALPPHMVPQQQFRFEDIVSAAHQRDDLAQRSKLKRIATGTSQLLQRSKVLRMGKGARPRRSMITGELLNRSASDSEHDHAADAGGGDSDDEKAPGKRRPTVKMPSLRLGSKLSDNSPADAALFGSYSSRVSGGGGYSPMKGSMSMRESGEKPLTGAEAAAMRRAKSLYATRVSSASTDTRKTHKSPKRPKGKRGKVKASPRMYVASPSAWTHGGDFDPDEALAQHQHQHHYHDDGVDDDDDNEMDSDDEGVEDLGGVQRDVARVAQRHHRREVGESSDDSDDVSSDDGGHHDPESHEHVAPYEDTDDSGTSEDNVRHHVQKVPTQSPLKLRQTRPAGDEELAPHDAAGAASGGTGRMPSKPAGRAATRALPTSLHATKHRRRRSRKLRKGHGKVKKAGASGSPHVTGAIGIGESAATRRAGTVGSTLRKSRGMLRPPQRTHTRSFQGIAPNLKRYPSGFALHEMASPVRVQRQQRMMEEQRAKAARERMEVLMAMPSVDGLADDERLAALNDEEFRLANVNVLNAMRNVAAMSGHPDVVQDDDGAAVVPLRGHAATLQRPMTYDGHGAGAGSRDYLLRPARVSQNNLGEHVHFAAGAGEEPQPWVPATDPTYAQPANEYGMFGYGRHGGPAAHHVAPHPPSSSRRHDAGAAPADVDGDFTYGGTVPATPARAGTAGTGTRPGRVYVSKTSWYVDGSAELAEMERPQTSVYPLMLAPFGSNQRR